MLQRINITALLGAAILLTSIESFAKAPAADTGVRGSVSLSPGCPGPQREDQACTKTLPGKEIQLLGGSGKVVAKSMTSDAGQFTIKARPGKYTLQIVSEAMYPKCQKVEVVITKHQIVESNISCDSGMR